jgi:hypothetical protein
MRTWPPELDESQPPRSNAVRWPSLDLEHGEPAGDENLAFGRCARDQLHHGVAGADDRPDPTVGGQRGQHGTQRVGSFLDPRRVDDRRDAATCGGSDALRGLDRGCVRRRQDRVGLKPARAKHSPESKGRLPPARRQSMLDAALAGTGLGFRVADHQQPASWQRAGGETHEVGDRAKHCGKVWAPVALPGATMIRRGFEATGSGPRPGATRYGRCPAPGRSRSWGFQCRDSRVARSGAAALEWRRFVASTRSRRRTLAAALALVWVLGPALPAMACALTQALAAAALDAGTPDCHRSEPRNGTTAAPSHRTCCDDVATSCCLATLDVDGAVSTATLLDAPIVTLTSIVELSAPLACGFAPTVDAVAESPPRERAFRVLRL